MQEEFLRWPKSFGKCKHRTRRRGGQPVQAPGGESLGQSSGLRGTDLPPDPALSPPASTGRTVGVLQ